MQTSDLPSDEDEDEQAGCIGVYKVEGFSGLLQLHVRLPAPQFAPKKGFRGR